MTEPAYPAARIVAPKVEAHFAHHAEEARRRGRGWASRRRLTPTRSRRSSTPRSGRACAAKRATSPRSRSRFCRPRPRSIPLLFERPLPLEPGALVKVAPAVERAGIHLGVWRNDQGLYVWGTVRAIPALCLVVEVAAPGLLVVKHHRGDESGKFVNVAVLEGDQIKVVDEHASSLPDCPPLLTSLLGFDSPASWVKGIDSVNVLVQLAVSMRAHGRGGCCWSCPTGATRGWSRSCGRFRTRSCRRLPSSRSSIVSRRR